MKNRDNLMRHINVGKQLFSCILTEYEDNLANINDDICIKTISFLKPGSELLTVCPSVRRADYN